MTDNERKTSRYYYFEFRFFAALLAFFVAFTSTAPDAGYRTITGSIVFTSLGSSSTSMISGAEAAFLFFFDGSLLSSASSSYPTFQNQKRQKYATLIRKLTSERVNGWPSSFTANWRFNLVIFNKNDFFLFSFPFSF